MRATTASRIPWQNGGGRQTNATADALQRALRSKLGPGSTWVRGIHRYLFHPAVRARLVRDPALMKVALRALEATPAVARAFRAKEVASAAARSSTDPVLRAAALSYHPARSGDVIIVPREYWLLSASATTHGTHQAYDQQGPVTGSAPGDESRSVQQLHRRRTLRPARIPRGVRSDPRRRHPDGSARENRRHETKIARMGTRPSDFAARSSPSPPIPPGRVATYGEGGSAGRPRAWRAVGHIMRKCTAAELRAPRDRRRRSNRRLRRHSSSSARCCVPRVFW